MGVKPDCPPVITIDPSSTCTGWAVFNKDRYVASGSIHRQKSEPVWEVTLIEELDGILHRHDLDCAVIEDIGNWRQGRGARFAWAKSVGIAEALCRRLDMVVSMVSSKWLAGMSFRGDSAAAKKLRRLLASEIAGADIHQVDEATAILLYFWWRNGTAPLPPARRPSRKVGSHA